MRSVIGGIVVAAAALTACGGSGGSPAVTVETVRAAAGASTTSSARTRAAVDGLPGSGGKPVVVEGAVDFASSRAQLETDGRRFGASGKVTLILDHSVGLVEYVHLPAIALDAPGKSWVSVDIGAAMERAGYSVSDAGDDPASQVAVLRGAESVTTVGHETLRGAKTAHERVVVNLRRAADQAPEAQRPALERNLTHFRTPTITYDIWLDDAGRVRRARYTIRQEDLFLRPQEAFSTPLTYELELWDFGTATHIEVPSPNDTISAADLAARRRQQAK